MKVVVLGNKGMLGRYVETYLNQQGFEVVGLNREHLDAMTADSEIFNKLKMNDADVVINCIGIIPQRGKTPDVMFTRVNSLFPYLVSEYCRLNDIHFIHVTTDCVFDGLEGGYSELSVHSAKDIYGRSKSLGEPSNATIIRTSIIGEELENKKSLLEWVRSNKGKTVKGYTNHRWNGVTCLELATIFSRMIKHDIWWKGVKHVHSPDSYSKAGLVELISDVYELDITVEPFETEQKCDRTLSSVEPISLSSLRTQLKELKDFKI